MTLPNRKDTIVAVALLAAVVGVAPFTGPGCDRLITVQDSDTGEIRKATTQEVEQLVKDAGDIAKVITITTGHPEAVPFIEIAVRLAAILVAFFYGRAPDRRRPAPLEFEPERATPEDPNP